MPTKRSAVDSLRKLEAERQALDERQRELEEKAALELGQLILGSGVEAFSRKGLKQASEVDGRGVVLTGPTAEAEVAAEMLREAGVPVELRAGGAPLRASWASEG